MNNTEPHQFIAENKKFVRAPYSLNHFAKNIFSQNGEDGILEYIFSKIGVKEHYGIEFGAWDGKHLSNIFNLVKNHGWQALMIEASRTKYSALLDTVVEVEGRIHPVCGFVEFEGNKSLDNYMMENNVPPEPDLLSIDVDGVDWFIWESVKKFRPRVVVIEFNPTIPIDILFIQAKNPLINEGASAAALVHLGREKGYSLVAVTACNVIFVNETEAPLLGVEKNSLENLWEKPAEGRIFHGYNGKIYTANMPRLVWQKIPIAPDALQIRDNFSYGGAPSR